VIETPEGASARRAERLGEQRVEEEVGREAGVGEKLQNLLACCCCRVHRETRVLTYKTQAHDVAGHVLDEEHCIDTHIQHGQNPCTVITIIKQTAYCNNNNERFFFFAVAPTKACFFLNAFIIVRCLFNIRLTCYQSHVFYLSTLI
jgi:hypothetical protein